MARIKPFHTLNDDPGSPAREESTRAASISSTSSADSIFSWQSDQSTSSVDIADAPLPGRVPTKIMTALDINSPGASLVALMNSGLFTHLVLHPPTPTHVDGELAFHQKLSLSHYHHGCIDVQGLGLSKTAAIKSAKSRTITIILEAEKDLNLPIIRLPPRRLILSPKAAAIVASQSQQLQRLKEIGNAYWSGGIVCIDVESWEQSQHDTILEVGVVVSSVSSLWQPDEDDGFCARHFIIKEHVDKRNGCMNWSKDRLPDEKFNFLPEFGHSEVLPQALAVERVTEMLEEMRTTYTHVYLLGHSINGDIKWLQESLGISVADLTPMDVADAFAAVEGRRQRRKLTYLCEHYGLQPRSMHNGGNDAVFTRSLCKRMVQRHTGEMMRLN